MLRAGTVRLALIIDVAVCGRSVREGQDAGGGSEHVDHLLEGITQEIVKFEAGGRGVGSAHLIF